MNYHIPITGQTRDLSQAPCNRIRGDMGSLTCPRTIGGDRIAHAACAFPYAGGAA